jgi:hypothetical protein
MSFALCGIRAETMSEGRKPLLSATNAELKYKPTGTRFRKDPSSQQLVEYALEGKIIYDSRTDTYLLQWIGYDGNIKKLTWIPPNKVNALVAGAVHYDSGGRVFEYSYDILNLPTSLQKLQSFYVTSQTEVVAGSNPDGTWYSSEFTPYLRKVFKAEDGWTWSQTIGQKLGLEPGEPTKGFKLRSSGLPMVGKCYVRGQAGTLQSSEDVPEELMDAIDQAAWRVPYGFTVVPGLTPDKLSPQRILENISHALRVAPEQGWFAKSYDGKDLMRLIEEMRRTLDSGNQVEVQRLTKYATRVADEAKAHHLIQSEIHGLLGSNLEILRQRVSSSPRVAASSDQKIASACRHSRHCRFVQTSSEPRVRSSASCLGPNAPVAFVKKRMTEGRCSYRIYWMGFRKSEAPT